MPRRSRSLPSHDRQRDQPQRLQEVEHRAAVEPAFQRLAQRALLVGGVGAHLLRLPGAPRRAILPPAAHDAADRAEIAARVARQQRQVHAQHRRRQRRRQIRDLRLQRRALRLLRLRQRPLDRIERDLDPTLLERQHLPQDERLVEVWEGREEEGDGLDTGVSQEASG